MWLTTARPDAELKTRGGNRVRVIDPGVRNRHDGPDFLRASITFDGALRRGDIELHVRPEDWVRHGHDRDPLYDRVILHVCLYDGIFPAGIPGIVLADNLGRPLRAAWADARAQRHPLACRRSDMTHNHATRNDAARIDTMRVDAMTALLAARRFERKRRRFELRLDVLTRELDPATAFRQLVFEGIARAAGYGGNEQLFESIARAKPLRELKGLSAPARLELLASAARGGGNSAAVMPHNRVRRRLAWFAAFAPCLDEPTWWRALLTSVREGTQDAATFIPHFQIDDIRDNPGVGRVAEIVINVLGPALHLYATRRGDAALARRAGAMYFSTFPAPANRHTRLIAQAFDLSCTAGGAQQGMIELSTEFCLDNRCISCLNHRA